MTLLMAAPSARADTILLRGGERLIGHVVSEEPAKIRFESQTLGVLEIPRDRVERIERDAPPPPPETAAVAAPAAKEAEKETIAPAPPAPSAGGKALAVTEQESGVHAPPPERAGQATPKAMEQEAIIPAPPPTPAVSTIAPVVAEKEAIQSAGPVVAPAPAPVAVPVVVVEPPTMPTPGSASSAQPPAPAPVAAVAVSEPPAPPPAAPPAEAPVVTTVFYPWSGLRTDQDTFDWIQLKSGEWLKGKIKGMQNFKLEFDSEKMNLREFDWEDIVIVRSPKLNSVWFGREGGTAAGSLLVTGNEVKVVSTSGTRTFARNDLLAITPTGSKERNNWSGKVAIGLNLRAGNTTETSYNASYSIQRRTPLTRLKLDYLGNYSDINGTVNEENQRLTGTFDYFFSRRLYMRLPDAEYYRDPLQNIQQRVTLGAGLGYDFFRTKDFEWDASAGPAYYDTRFISVEPGQSQREKSVAFVFGTHFDWQLTRLIEWTVDYRSQVSGKKSAGGTTQHLNSTVEFEIHKRLKLDVSFIWDRVGNPKADSNGVTPEPDDYRLITSLGVDF